MRPDGHAAGSLEQCPLVAHLSGLIEEKVSGLSGSGMKKKILCNMWVIVGPLPPVLVTTQ